jgi:hypothetical protein
MPITIPLTPTANSVWRLDVDTSATITPEWTQVRGCQSIGPVVNDSVQDATDLDADGWGADAITIKKWQVVLACLRKIDETGAQDVGQEALRAAGEARELVHVRWYDRTPGGLGEAYEGYALVQWTAQAGTAEGLQLVNVTLLGQGAREEIVNPVAGP